MSKNITIEVHQASKTSKRKLVLSCQVNYSDFNEHDLAAVLFSMEFSINNHCELPLRVHIMEDSQ